MGSHLKWEKDLEIAEELVQMAPLLEVLGGWSVLRILGCQSYAFLDHMMGHPGERDGGRL